jgi:hypothetical protein
MSQLHELVDQARVKSPLGSKGFYEKGMASSRPLPDHKDGVIKPAKTHLSQALIVALMTEKAGDGGHEADDGLAHSPLTILGEASYGWEEDVVEKIDPNDLDSTLKIGHNVEAHLRVLISQELYNER